MRPVNPITLICEGYGNPVDRSGIVIAVELIKVVVLSSHKKRILIEHIQLHSSRIGEPLSRPIKQ